MTANTTRTRGELIEKEMFGMVGEMKSEGRLDGKLQLDSNLTRSHRNHFTDLLGQESFESE
jgi:hypothetical protein